MPSSGMKFFYDVVLYYLSLLVSCTRYTKVFVMNNQYYSSKLQIDTNSNLSEYIFGKDIPKTLVWFREGAKEPDPYFNEQLYIP